MSFIGFMNYLMSWYCLKNYFELVFYIIFLTFVVFIIELAAYVVVEEIVKAILRRFMKVKPQPEKVIIDDFFIEGLSDLPDYDIYVPLKDQEP